MRQRDHGEAFLPGMEMEMEKIEQIYESNIQLTLERHFEELGKRSSAVEEIRSLWILVKKKIEDKLLPSRSTFVNYSLHDGSHSRTIIRAIERFLGEERICRLSATDTFMLLVCAYAHDYGMALTFNKIYDILGSAEFEAFLKKAERNADYLEKEDINAVKNLLYYIGDGKPNISLQEIYFSIMMVIQLYQRPAHWKGVMDVRRDFESLFEENIKRRFVFGTEGIVNICMCHGQTVKNMLKMPAKADGMCGDDYHPRFVAALLRLGDLLDMDNDRFPDWFVKEIAKDKNIIPKLSVMHYRKHEAVSHMLITPDEIEVIVQCYSKRDEVLAERDIKKEEFLREMAQKECNQVAALVSEWTEMLTKEREELVMQWNRIAPPNFGNPPANIEVHIYVDDMEYMAENKTFQMKMSQERVMKLLEGTSIYRDKYVGIREMVQNAIDASLLQLWYDLLHNRYISYGLSKSVGKYGLSMLDLLKNNRTAIFGNYDVTVEVIEDKMREQVIIVVKDKGIGITKEEIKYIADLGSSKENNDRVRRLSDSMPAWLRPAGVFGIGLQSVFQLTDCVDFYTRQHNEPERLISLYSYGKNHGKIEVQDLPENPQGLYYNNSVPGTNVKIVVKKEHYLENDGAPKDSFQYYDVEFDAGEELDILYTEIAVACKKKIKESPVDYFNVYFEETIIEKDGYVNERKSTRKRLRKSYFYLKGGEKGKFGETLNSFSAISAGEYCFKQDQAIFWDEKTYRCYCLTIRPCKIVQEEESGRRRLILPEKVANLYNICYKFNMISNAESIYAHQNGHKQLHAGFLKLDVLIMDDRPMEYMNIDRDRLREGAIDEEELLAVRREILKKWCQFLCDRKETGGQGTKQEAVRPLFFDKPEVLISMLLLFYQNVDQDLFGKFLKLYKKTVSDWGLYLEDEEISVEQLWESGNCFRVGIQQPYSIPRCDEASEDPKASEEPKSLEIKQKTICKLPHRLVHVKNIQYIDNTLWYYMSLGPSSKKYEGIQMSGEARLYDYLSVLERDDDPAKNINYQSLIKKVFKPDKKFSKLIVPCFPQTFEKGRNWEADIDYYIGHYILSPFDRESSGIIADSINSHEDKGSILEENVKKSKQLEKCVDYVIKKSHSSQQKDKNAIRDQYIDFVRSFYREVKAHADLLDKICV